jgi:hypothetical protein
MGGEIRPDGAAGPKALLDPKACSDFTIANRWCRWKYLSGFNKWKSRPLY